MQPDHTDPALDYAVARFLYREGRLIDARRWEEWLALYAPDAVFWMPHRRADGTIPNDPEDEINLLYLTGREALANRVQRATGGDSVANTPLPRTSHLIGSVVAEPLDGQWVRATASWIVTATNPARGMQQRTGYYEHLLRREGQGFRIARKQVVALDEVFDGFLDVYLV